MWVAIGLLIRNAWVWAARGAGRVWTLAAVRVVMLLNISMAFNHSATAKKKHPTPPKRRT